MKTVLYPLVSSAPMRCILCLLIASIGVWGQTAGTALSAFSEESVISPDAIDTVTAANIPPDILAAIQGGAQELHQSINYLPSQNALQVTGFVEAKGSPVPTQPSAMPAIMLWSYTLAVTNTLFTSKPQTTVTFVGNVSASNGSTFGNLAGANVVVSAAYSPATGSTPAAPMQFAAVTTNIVGSAALFAPSGLGDLQVPTGAAATLTAIAGPKGVITTSPSFQLTAAQSSDPTGSKLTYQWTFQAFIPGQTVQMDDPASATPTISFPQNDPFAYVDYTFQLTVTNASGATGTDKVTVSYAAPGS